MPGRLASKVALISGTAGGQGRRAAVHFAAEGEKVVGCDVKVAEAEETVELVRAAGGDMVSFQPVDLAEEDAVQQWIADAVQAFGDFDILYNNAAVAKAANVEDVTRADWDWNMANEPTLVFLAVKHAIPVFERRGGGVIINVGSIAGMVGSGMPGNAAGNLVHCVAKAAVIRLTENLAIEPRPARCTSNSISPGVIDMPQLRPFLGEEPDAPLRALREQVPHPTHRRGGGHRERGGVPRVRRILIHHRRQPAGGRRVQRLWRRGAAHQ